MKRFLILTKAQTLIYLRNGQVLFWNFAFPVMLLVIYGVVFSSYKVGTDNYMAWVMPGVVILNTLAFGLVGSPALMLEMREKGILRRLRATPLPALQLIGSYLAVNIIIGLLQALIVIVVSALFYQVPLTLIGVTLALPMFVLSLLTFIAFGQVISGFVAKASAAVALGQVAYFGQMFITNLILPLDMMPSWLQSIVPYLPGYVAGDLMRTPLLSGALGANALAQLLMLSAYGIAAMLIAAKLFRWDPKA